MNYQMLDVLRHSGDRLVWDFRKLPSLAESCERYGTSLNYSKFALGTNSQPELIPSEGAIYWPGCEHVGRVFPDFSIQNLWKQQHAALLVGWDSITVWGRSQWSQKYTLAWHGIRWAWRGLITVWHTVPDTVKYAGLAYAIWRCTCLLHSQWQEQRTIFDGQDNIAFCGTCTPQLMDDTKMVLGNAYEKRFHVPAACPRCSRLWAWKGWKDARMRIGNSHYQFFGTYTALRMQRARDVHCPAVNQLDIPNEYRFAHRFMQIHGGTIGALESKQRGSWSNHTRSYCLATQWEEIDGGEATTYQAQKPAAPAAAPAPTTPPPPAAPAAPPDPATPSPSGAPEAPAPPPNGAVAPADPTNIQRMRELWQFVTDNNLYYPQSTLLWSPYDRCRKLIGRKGTPVFSTTAHYRMALLGIDSRLVDTRFMRPPPDIVMAPIAQPSAQAVGPVTHPLTVHNAQDKPSVVASLEGRSTVKQSVFPDANGVHADLAFKKSSKAAQRLNKFWRKFNQVCLTDKAIDNAYHKLFAGKSFKEIAMSKFSQTDIEAIQVELQTTTDAVRIGTRKANGKLEAVIKEGKPGRIVVDNTLQLLAINIISTSIYQHIIFDHDDGIFYDMSIKHRARDKVLDSFGEMMKDPWGDKKRAGRGNSSSSSSRNVPTETCSWEIDQTGMELHERCDKHGEGLLGYTYNALMRINRRVSHKINGEFTDLHEAKIVHDVKTGMQIRFRIKCGEVPKETWFTAKFLDMYLDSGWSLTSGVNMMNELSGVFSSIADNPEHLFAINSDTGKFRLQDGTFDWQFMSVPLYQTLTSPSPSSFPIRLRGLFEGDDGGGAASRCLADERNGGKQGLIIHEQEDLGYSAKLKTIIDGRVEIIGAHFPVKDGLVCSDVPWIPAVQRYTSKLGVQTNINITPTSRAARFLSLACMFTGRNEPLQRGFELSAIRVINEHSKDKEFWTSEIKTDGYQEIDRAFGDGTHCTYTLEDVKAHYDRCANKVHQTTQTQIRMLNMSIAEDVDANVVTRDDFAKLGLFAEECHHFGGDHESAYSFLPTCFR